jgi:hypothetical protein
MGDHHGKGSFQFPLMFNSAAIQVYKGH